MKGKGYMIHAATKDKTTKEPKEIRKYLTLSIVSSFVRIENTRETIKEKITSALRWFIDNSDPSEELLTTSNFSFPYLCHRHREL